MRQSIRRIKTAMNRENRYLGVLSTHKRSVPFRKMTPEKIQKILRMYRDMEIDFRKAAQKDNSGGWVKHDDGPWQESRLTMTDHAESCAGVVKMLRKELSRRANQGKQRV